MGGRGSGGRNRKPDYLKKLEGTWRKDRAKGKNQENGEDLLTPRLPPQHKAESKSPVSYPRAPAGLGDAGKKLWRRVVQNWILDEGELFVLERACESMDELKAAQEVLSRTGETTINKDGLEVPHPCCLLRKDAKTALLRFWRELDLDHSPLED